MKVGISSFGNHKHIASEKLSIKQYGSAEEDRQRAGLFHLMQHNPIPQGQQLSNLGLFLESKALSRILFMDFIYRQIIDIQGVIMEFGTRWGQNLALFSALRGIYEPFNRHRKIIGFDTFSGFPSIHQKDGKSSMMQKGQLALTQDYDKHLESILQAHEQLSPLSHITKYELCKGDAVRELPRYIKRNPHTIVALAFFDFDLYKPTLRCLELIRPRLTKGSIVGFDELNDPDSPGETAALQEVFGLQNVRLRRFRYTSRVSYFVVE